MSDQPDTLEESTEKYDINVDPDKPTREELSPHDLILEDLMNVFLGLNDEHVGASVGITLSFAGTVVSGLMITRPEFQKRLADLIAPSSTVVAEGLTQLWERRETAAQAFAKGREDANLPNFRRNYIHLMNAQVENGSEVLRDGLWRGRLSEVSGWILGNYSPSQ
ncbi:hypothetical protein [Subtercola boreus]|uniref:hypothetical protein n=1 Tax=Subtercola boreus TaxID=120213 RepID=UPI00114F00F0|nr:hypothetical protein [Subtercola boreus]TQL56096.1 hypothetical protein FB464_3678 [Subtercola boreus]